MWHRAKMSGVKEAISLLGAEDIFLLDGTYKKDSKYILSLGRR